MIISDDLISDILRHKKHQQIVTKLFIIGRKLNFSLVFITCSYGYVPKHSHLNSTHYFIMKIPNKQDLQQIAINYSSDIDLKDLINLYKKFTVMMLLLHQIILYVLDTIF